jgi:hypothetical protein
LVEAYQRQKFEAVFSKKDGKQRQVTPDLRTIEGHSLQAVALHSKLIVRGTQGQFNLCTKEQPIPLSSFMATKDRISNLLKKQ